MQVQLRSFTNGHPARGFDTLVSRALPVLCGVALVALAGCASTAKSDAAPSDGASASSDAASGPSDAEIAAIVVAANSVDIEAGKLAQSQSTSEAIRTFAERMVVDHTAVNEQAVALVTRLGVTPVESDASRGLLADGEKTREHLSTLAAADFDKAYAEHEVAYHEAVINVVDTVLLPSAQNQELKDLLTAVRPALVAHLEHARQMQSSPADGAEVVE